MNFKRISSFTFVVFSLLLTDVNSMGSEINNKLSNKLNNTFYYLPNKNIKNIPSSVVINFQENGMCCAKECIGDEERKKKITISKLSKEFNDIFKYSCSASSISTTGNYLFIKDLCFKTNLRHFAIGAFLKNIKTNVVISNIDTYFNRNCKLSVQNIHELVFDSKYNNNIYFRAIKNLGKNDMKVLYNKITIGENTYNYKEDGIITVHTGENELSTDDNTYNNYDTMAFFNGKNRFATAEI